MPSIRGLSTSSVICTECFALTSEVIACSSCHHTVPITSEFVRDPSLSRRSNAGLCTPADAAFFQEQLTRAKRLLRTYDFLIDALDESYAQVDELVDYYTSCLKVGVKRLPAELLSLIFRFSCAGTMNHVFGIPDESSSSIPISQVCQSWRHVALRTPSLWKDISLETMNPRTQWGQKERIARLEILNMCLRRSRFAPLKMVFAIDPACPIPDLQEIGALLSIEAYDRLAALDIDPRSHSPPLGRMPRVFPCLEELVISGISSQDTFERFGLGNPNALPQLRKLTLSELPQNNPPHLLFLSLRSLTIDFFMLDGIPSTIWWSQAPHLEELVIDYIDLGDLSAPTKTIVFPELRRLSIKSPGLIPHDTFQLMSLFKTPHLQSLSIWCFVTHIFPRSAYRDDIDPPSVPTDPYRLVDFASRAEQCTSLTLEDILLSPASLRDLLNQLSSLQTLKLRQIYYRKEQSVDNSDDEGDYESPQRYQTSLGSQLFQALTQVHLTTHMPIILPALLNLEIEAPSTCLHPSGFVEFLRIRIFGERQLRRAKFTFIVQPLPQVLVRDLKSIALELRAKKWVGGLMIRHEVPTTMCGENSMHCDTAMAVYRKVVDLGGSVFA
ncbi:hypothetical protein DL96DRAFT_519337 [Flagelloscypha sp. PMI_526]|nr:hypothetical protein DL96DRAFT_519337 [Flagelloscypha sp. PMI_526]